MNNNLTAPSYPTGEIHHVTMDDRQKWNEDTDLDIGDRVVVLRTDDTVRTNTAGRIGIVQFKYPNKDPDKKPGDPNYRYRLTSEGNNNDSVASGPVYEPTDLIKISKGK